MVCVQQFELDRKIAVALQQDYEALQQVRSLRAQLKSLADHAAIAKTAAELEAKAAAIEGEEAGYGAHYLSTPEGRSLARLNSGLNTLVSALDTADAAPTTQQKVTFVEIEKALEDAVEGVGRTQVKRYSGAERATEESGIAADRSAKARSVFRRYCADNVAGSGQERGIDPESGRFLFSRFCLAYSSRRLVDSGLA